MANSILDNLIDYLKPKAHDAIDYITDLFKSNEEIEFEKLLESSGIKKDSKEFTILKSYMEKAGMPYIKSSKDAWPTFKKGKWEYGLYGVSNPSFSSKRITPDTLNIRPGNIDDFVEELAHAIQYNPRTKDGEYRDNLKAIRDSLKYEGYSQMKEFGQKRYKIPGTVEYQAHEEIAPEIWRDLWLSDYPVKISKFEKIQKLNK